MGIVTVLTKALNQISPVHNLQFYFLKIHFNITSSTLSSSKLCVPSDILLLTPSQTQFITNFYRVL
jgi:hypothetical protein